MEGVMHPTKGEVLTNDEVISTAFNCFQNKGNEYSRKRGAPMEGVMHPTKGEVLTNDEVLSTAFNYI